MGVEVPSTFADVVANGLAKFLKIVSIGSQFGILMPVVILLLFIGELGVDLKTIVSLPGQNLSISLIPISGISTYLLSSDLPFIKRIKGFNLFLFLSLYILSIAF